MTKQNEYARLRRAKLKESGICPMCAKTKPEPGFINCSNCREQIKHTNKKWRDKNLKERKQQGLCACGQKTKDNRKLCESCTSYVKERYYKRKARGMCSYCSNRALDGLTRCSECAERSKEDRRILRQEVFNAYGGAVCNCCGETLDQFLTIDHIENDGSHHRKDLHQSLLYKWLKQEGFPSGFQVLCWNCNIGKSKNGGICPHKKIFK